MNLKSIEISGTNYTEIDRINVNVRDSFVSTENKLVTVANAQNPRPSSGETRLYVGSEAQVSQGTFFIEFSNTLEYYSRTREALPSGICFFSKRNLLKYLRDAEKEYYYPSQNYFYDISSNYRHNHFLIRSLQNEYIPFTLFHHDGQQDHERFYVNSLDDIWDIFRKVSLPVITYVTIYKMIDSETNIVYFFELSLQKQFKSLTRFNLTREIEAINSLDISETEKKALVNARHGQGKYKINLLQTMRYCPFTGIDDRFLLIASHIKPWALSNNTERLDGYNGLLLTPTYDILFDKGLISFENSGNLLISPLLSSSTITKLGLLDGQCYDIGNSHGNRNQYLEYHRLNIFKKDPLLV